MRVKWDVVGRRRRLGGAGRKNYNDLKKITNAVVTMGERVEEEKEG